MKKTNLKRLLAYYLAGDLSKIISRSGLFIEHKVSYDITLNFILRFIYIISYKITGNIKKAVTLAMVISNILALIVVSPLLLGIMLLIGFNMKVYTNYIILFSGIALVTFFIGKYAYTVFADQRRKLEKHNTLDIVYEV